MWFLAIIAIPSLAQTPAASMGVPSLRPPFPLAQCTVVHPSSEVGVVQAQRIAEAIQTLGGSPLIVDAATALEPSGLRLKDEIARRPHVLLGNINTNRGLLEYYADLLDFSDAYHPGGDGFVLRTVPRGSGRGGDALIVGASSDEGLRRGCDRLMELLAAANGLTLPYVFETKLGGAVAESLPLRTWPEPFEPDRWINVPYTQMINLPGFAYALAAYVPAAQVTVAGLLKGAEENGGWYPVGDYDLEWLARAWGYVRDAPCVTEQDAQTIDNALLQTLYRDQNEYWRARDGSRIGGRHQTMGTSAFYAAVRLLLRRGSPDPVARGQLETWAAECAAYFANATKTFHDDIEGIPSYHSFQPIANEALRTGAAEYFEQTLDLAVRRALAVTDNLGFYAGTGTYEEARPGTTRTGIMLGYPLAMAAYLKSDAGYEWLLRHFPGTTRNTWGFLVVWGARAFFRPLEVPAQEPKDLLGVLVVPLGAYRQAKLGDKAPTGAYEKVCLRDSFDPRGQYMVIQGFQEIGADNLPPRDANSIIRYTDLGHIWLYANSERSGNLHRNAVYVSDGLNETYGAPACELVGNVDVGPIAVVASRLRNYVAADWTRTVFWRKGRYFVVIDLLTQTREGEFLATCTFRTPCPAEASEQGMRAWEGDAELRILNADGVPQSVRRYPGLEGAGIPTFLRQRQPMAQGIGSHVVFRNLIYANDPGRTLSLQLRPVGDWAGMVRGQTPDGEEFCLIGVCPEGGRIADGLLKTSESFFLISPDALICTPGAVELNGTRITPDTPGPQIRTELERLWNSLSEAKAPTGATRHPRLAEHLLSFHNFSPRGEAILGPDLTVVPPPTGGLALDLIDGTIPLWQAVSFPREDDVQLNLDLRQGERIAAIEIATGLVAGTNVLPNPDNLPPPRPASLRLDGTPREVEFVPGFTYEPLHKGVVCPMGRWRVDLGGIQARHVQILLPKHAWPGGAGIREVIVRRAGTNEVTPTHAEEADIDGDADAELLLAADSGEVVCLSSSGTEEWRQTLGGPITALECLDFGEGRPAILAATREARLYRLTAGGGIAWVADFIHMTQENGDLPTAYSIGHWTDRNGRPEIVCGNYNACSFVTPDGAGVEYCRAAGAFETMLLPEAMDLNEDGVEDQLLYNVWHSISVIDGAQRKSLGYRSAPGGEGLCMEWWSRNPSEPLLLIAAESGVGLMNAKTGQYRWLREISPLSGCVIGDFGRDIGRVGVVTKRDGFVLAFNEAGDIVRRTRIEEMIDCAAAVELPDGSLRLVMGTERGIIAFDRELRDPVLIAPGTARKLLASSRPGTLIVLRPTATVDVLGLR